MQAKVIAKISSALRTNVFPFIVEPKKLDSEEDLNSFLGNISNQFEPYSSVTLALLPLGHSCMYFRTGYSVSHIQQDIEVVMDLTERLLSHPTIEIKHADFQDGGKYFEISQLIQSNDKHIKAVFECTKAAYLSFKDAEREAEEGMGSDDEFEAEVSYFPSTNLNRVLSHFRKAWNLHYSTITPIKPLLVAYEMTRLDIDVYNQIMTNCMSDSESDDESDTESESDYLKNRDNKDATLEAESLSDGSRSDQMKTIARNTRTFKQASKELANHSSEENLRRMLLGIRLKGLK